MPRNVTQLDKKDKQILALLNIDGRLTQTQIGNKIKMSRELVKYRIEKLVRENYISGFNIIVSNRALGFETYSIIFRLQNVTNEIIKEITLFIKEHPKIKFFDRSSGDWDFNIIVAVRGKYGLTRFIDEINELYGQHFSEYTLYTRVAVLKHDNLEWIAKVDYKPKMFDFYEGEVILDQKDNRMLRKLAQNGNISFADLSRQAKINPETCAQRFKKLREKNVILKAKALINYEKFDVQQYVLYLKINQFSREKRKKFTNFLRSEKSIVFAERVLGDYDVKIVIIAENQRKFDEEFTKVRAYLKHDIRKYSFAIVLEIIRRESYPKGMW